MLAQYGRQDSNLCDLAPKASAWPLRYARLCRSDGTRTHAQLLMREPLSPLSYGAMMCRVGFEPTRFLPGLRPGPFGLSGICTWCDRRDSNAHSFERRSRRRGSASFPHDRVVGEVGLEPTWPCGRRVLSALGLQFPHSPDWCDRRESNSDARRHRVLSAARLPVSSRSHGSRPWSRTKHNVGNNHAFNR